MASSKIYSISVLFLISLIYGNNVDALQAITQATNKFTLDLYENIRHSPGNFIVSPVSLHMVLAMALQGANGVTAIEMAKVMHLTENTNKYVEEYQSLLDQLEDPVLRLAARMYIEKSLSIFPEFNKTLSQYFLAEVQQVDFMGNAENSRLEINGWVEVQTKLRIKDLLPEGSLTSSTQLVLVNALHFKSDWKIKFNKKKTIEEPFYIKPNVSVNVQMMALFNERFRTTFDNVLEAEIIEIPYVGNAFKMVIILPEKVDGITKVESELASLNINELLSKLTEQEIDIYLPKFKIRKSFDMVNPLKKMGMTTAFSEEADFSRISNASLSISKIVQKAFLVVNERGSEAAAAAGTIITTKILSLSFKCNRPFIYMIMKNDVILFAGRFLKP